MFQTNDQKLLLWSYGAVRAAKSQEKLSTYKSRPKWAGRQVESKTTPLRLVHYPDSKIMYKPLLYLELMCRYFSFRLWQAVFAAEKHAISSKYGASPTEEMQPRRINTIIRNTTTASSCDHLLFMSQQNVTAGLSRRTICLCGEAYTRLKVLLYCRYSTRYRMTQ